MTPVGSGSLSEQYLLLDLLTRSWRYFSWQVVKLWGV